MIDLDRLRPPGSAALLVRLGLEHGVPPTVALNGTGVDPQQLRDPERAVTAAVELRVIRNLQAALPGVDTLGIEAGRRYHLTTHGIWGFALASCRDGWEALRTGLAFIDLTWAFCQFSMTAEHGIGRLVLDDRQVPADVRSFLVQREIASSVTVAREVSGLHSVGASAARFRQPAPATTGPFTELLLVGPEFGAAENSVEIPTSLLDAPLPQADAHNAAVARAQCERTLDQWRARTSFADKVRQALSATPGHLPGIEEVACRLHVSSRTLRRRLGDEGSTFRGLVDEVRLHLAQDLLAEGNLSVEQISSRLGYSATSAFTAAFIRWTGMSPRSYQRTRL